MADNKHGPSLQLPGGAMTGNGAKDVGGAINSPRHLVRALVMLAGACPDNRAALARYLASMDPAEWDALLPTIVAEGLASAADAHLRAQGLIEYAPPHIREVLQAHHKRNAFSFFQHVYALALIARALDHQGVPFRVLKGLALAFQVYPTPTSRWVGDIDLWVQPVHAGTAVRAIQERGMRLMKGQAQTPSFLLAYGNELAFVPGEGEEIVAAVDVHWRLAMPWWMRAALRLGERELFDRPADVTIAGRTYQTLEATDNLWYLCIHAGVGHRYEGVRWLVDIALLASSGRIDWHRLNSMTTHSRTGVMLWRAFELLDAALGTSYRARLERPPTRTHRRLLRMVLPGFPDRKNLLLDNQPDVALPLDQLVLLPNMRAVAKAASLLLWPPPRWMRLRYPGTPPKGMFRARAHHLARLRHLLRRKA